MNALREVDLGFPCSDNTPFSERRVAGLASDDEVVMEGDTEDIASLAELPGHFDILPTRLRIARGMVVSADDGRGVVEQGRLVDIAGANDRPTEAALRRLHDGLYDVRRVQKAGDKHLAGRRFVELLPEELAYVIGRGHLIAFAGAVEAFLFPELDARFTDGVVFKQSHGI